MITIDNKTRSSEPLLISFLNQFLATLLLIPVSLSLSWGHEQYTFSVLGEKNVSADFMHIHSSFPGCALIIFKKSKPFLKKNIQKFNNGKTDREILSKIIMKGIHL